MSAWREWLRNVFITRSQSTESDQSSQTMSDPVLIELPIGTNQPASGPVFRFGGQTLTVDYDNEDVDGPPVWTRLEFTGVNAVKFVDEGHSGIGDGGEFHHLICWDSSPWLDETVGNWKRNYSHWAMSDCAPSRHYLLYCDHAGSLHVIASDVKIIENPELDELNALPHCR